MGPIIQEPGHGVKTFDQKPTDRRLLAQPDRRADDENLRCLDLAPQVWPVVMIPTMLPHVGLHTESDVVRGEPDLFYSNTALAHDLRRRAHQQRRVRLPEPRLIRDS